ncbi:hypothetical protein VTN49DRAFT_1923 [Thermomyces lanuginosus]|uniref:uncharacterized protein n=1 Tax=Thermomyces lanuginosus TaxID=5541 RepID=UPI003743F8FE
MSLPKRHPPGLSSSISSKHSAGTNAPIQQSRPNETDQPRQPQHQGTTTESAAHADHYQAEDVSEEQPEHAVPTGSGRAEPNLFRPFFTLIEDAHSSDYHHPTVHYIFSDDDPEILTEASMRALGIGDAAPLPPRGEPGDSEGGNKQPATFLPPPVPGVKERYIILDVEPTSTGVPEGQFATSAGTGTTQMSSSPAQQKQQQANLGYRIMSAHSLSSDWQVLDAHLSPAPTFDTPQNADDASGGTLMLRIEGTSCFPRDIHTTAKDNNDPSQTLEEMMEQFEKRMGELRRVIEAGGQDFLSSQETAETREEAQAQEGHRIGSESRHEKQQEE